MQTAVVIPARFESSRFPGKPLFKIRGRELLGHVIDRCKEAFADELPIIVATDDDRIETFAAKQTGVTVIRTPPHCLNGTIRVFEAVKELVHQNRAPDVILHIQGDEPLLTPDMLVKLRQLMSRENVEMGTLAAPLRDEKLLMDPHQVKVAVGSGGRAIYFSRSLIPFGAPTYYGHIGVYGWKRWALESYCNLPPSLLERAESLEQLRWIDAGRPLHVEMTTQLPVSVNNPEDAALVELALSNLPPRLSRQMRTRDPDPRM